MFLIPHLAWLHTGAYLELPSSVQCANNVYILQCTQEDNTKNELLIQEKTIKNKEQSSQSFK